MKKLRIILPSFCLLIFTFAFTLVYASFSDDMTISATANVEKTTIRILKAEYNSSTGTASYDRPTIGQVLYLANDVIQTSLSLPVTLEAGASIKFNVLVGNYTNDNYEIFDQDFNNNNLDVLYSDEGCFLGEHLDSYNTYTCHITITNTSNASVSDNIVTTYKYRRVSDYTLIHYLQTLYSGIPKGYIDDLKDDTATTNAHHYVGTNPRNYVSFNGEVWRILGIEDNVKDTANDEPKTKVKLIKDTGIGGSDKLVWDVTGSGVNNKQGIADWNQSKLKSLLNGMYYGSSWGTCYYNDKSTWAWPCFYNNKGLNSNALISSTLWHTGATSTSTISTPLGLYQDLMSTNTAASGNCSGSTCNSGTPMSYQSEGKVGILAPYDLGYSTNGNSQSSRESCLSTSMDNNAWKSGGNCYSGSWLTHNTGNEWTIQPGYNNSNYSSVMYVASGGGLTYDNAHRSFYLRPVIYLDPDTPYLGGGGLSGNPYIIDDEDANGVVVVTFDGNGATGGSMSVQVIAKGKNKTLSPNEFTRTGYSFLGWDTNPNATTPTYLDQANVKTTDNSTNTTLYAIWKKETSFYEMMETAADKTTVINFTQTSEDSNTNGIYKYTGADSDGGSQTIYYYRGNVNNNLIFANYCWKIMRTTSVGGVKLLYNGTPENGTCPGNTNGISEVAYNTISSKEAAGYKYESGVQHGTAEDSTVKVANDAFIYNNIRGYVSYLDDISFCNDRTVASGESYSSNSFNFNRNYLGTPTLSCPNSDDNFTVGSDNGNAQLSLPIGLITADEMILGGAKNGADSANSTYYLNASYQYWTATPRLYNGTTVKMWRYNNADGSIGTADNEANNKYFRPVIALNANVNIDSEANGDGTASNPYKVLSNHSTQFAVSYDGNGSTGGSMSYQLAYENSSLKLLPNTFTKTGYHFIGWGTRYDSNVQFENEETITITGDLILYAVWEPDVRTFNYTGGVETYTTPISGNYRIDAYGAQGGTYNVSYGKGGNGGHAAGEVYLYAGEKLTIVVGNQPATNTYTGNGAKNEGLTTCTGAYGGCGSISGGYNGGGLGYHRIDCYEQGGGGATHIARNNDDSQYTLLSTYGNTTTAANYVLLVAGGGGGATGYQTAGGRYGTGGVGGGSTGGNGAYSMNSNCESFGYGGSQSAGGGYYVLTGHAYYSNVSLPAAGFGFGGNGDAGIGGSGGGAGWFGGRGNSCLGGGGGGSSYISGSLTNTTNDQGTNTGNGKVVITYLDN